MSILGQTGAKACRECGERTRAERDRLEAENAKLRGMVAVLWECCACNTDSFWCDGCDYHDVEGCKVKAQIDRMGIEAE